MITVAIHPDHPEPRKVEQAVEVLERGGVALYPTDTVYALGCAIDDRRSAERIYRLKQMNARQPLALICGDLRQVARYGVVSDYAYRQLRRFLPGPYTFVLPATREVPRVLLDKRRTVGIRVPRSLICKALVEGLGRPLLTSSAIPPGWDRACIDVEEGKQAWPNGLDVAIDGGPTPGKVSTVVVVTDDALEVVREGLGAEALLG
jgi:tRNA threonylcarbamoyl adenosine modification protein (Sua5/YciO/YrdC/YwlC family)